MDGNRDLELILRSRTPLIVIESRDEARILELLQSIAVRSASDSYMPLFRWTITDGLQRIDIALEPQAVNSAPTDVLKHIRAVHKPGIYVLLDFHPFLDDPVHIRLLKDICIKYRDIARQIVLISHQVNVPSELEAYCAHFDMALPSDQERARIIKQAVADYDDEHPGSHVQIDKKAHSLLIQNLAGLTYSDTQRLARNAIYIDGAITKSDLPGVMQAKYELLNRGGALQFEYDTARFSDVGGMVRLKEWLTQRRPVFRGDASAAHLDPPKGILLLGIQGCGKSLAAKATAAIFGVPLLRLDFGAIYDKYHGETERKLRESLNMADVMSPCVLWIDEIEKGIAGRGGETGTAQRVLGTFLTWMAERQSQVFVVATANDISMLPPELIRKGRFDEIFFVDLPDAPTRVEIFRIHMKARNQDPTSFDLPTLAAHAEGFSGAEIEQAIIAGMHDAFADGKSLTTERIIQALQASPPLSVTMAEQVQALRAWGKARCVPAD